MFCDKKNWPKFRLFHTNKNFFCFDLVKYTEELLIENQFLPQYQLNVVFFKDQKQLHQQYFYVQNAIVSVHVFNVVYINEMWIVKRNVNHKQNIADYQFSDLELNSNKIVEHLLSMSTVYFNGVYGNAK